MKIKLLVLTALLCLLTATAMADVFTITSSGVSYSATDSVTGAFYVQSTPITVTNASAGIGATDFMLSATGPTYTDAGIVLYFDGGLTLGDIGSVVASSPDPAPLRINLWLDTGGDGKFFTFNSSDVLTSLNGDTYIGGPSNVLGPTTSMYVLGGDGAGSSYTLAQLQAGDDPGVNDNTPVALWIGITDDGTSNPVTADISSIQLTPEVGSVSLLGTVILILGLGVTYTRRRQASAIHRG